LSAKAGAGAGYNTSRAEPQVVEPPTLANSAPTKLAYGELGPTEPPFSPHCGVYPPAHCISAALTSLSYSQHPELLL